MLHDTELLVAGKHVVGKRKKTPQEQKDREITQPSIIFPDTKSLVLLLSILFNYLYELKLKLLFIVVNVFVL